MGEVKPDLETFAKIKVVGVGGGGCAAVNRMIASDVRGIDFYAVNTDSQALHNSKVKTKVNIGKTLTKGLGAGMNPDVGRQAAEEDQTELQEHLKGADMVFITCGLGGGTGSGASPVIADIARESGALTVGVVTKRLLLGSCSSRIYLPYFSRSAAISWAKAPSEVRINPSSSLASPSSTLTNQPSP